MIGCIISPAEKGINFYSLGLFPYHDTFAGIMIQGLTLVLCRRKRWRRLQLRADKFFKTPVDVSTIQFGNRSRGGYPAFPVLGLGLDPKLQDGPIFLSALHKPFYMPGRAPARTDD